VPDVPVERLSLDDIPEIVAFLNEVWGASYGPGAPVFDAPYLRWLYGGPQQATTRLVGCRLNGRLIGMRVFLARTVAIGQQTYQALLNTHLAIHPTAPLSLKPRLFEELNVRAWYDRTLFPPVDVAYSAVETRKKLAARAASVLTRHGVHVSVRVFAHTVVTTHRTDQVLRHHTRRATLDDAASIARLHARQQATSTLSRCVTDAEIAHHWFAAPAGAVYVAENADGLSGALCVYSLNRTNGGSGFRVAVCEALLATEAGAAIPLLDRALRYQHRVHAKGLVCENATYLPTELQRACGLMPSLRQMYLVVATRTPVDIGAAWLIDVK
jgi:hypothetical protein